MRRVFPVLIAILLIAAIIGWTIHTRTKPDDEYGTEVMDLKEYFGAENGKLAIFLQNERVAEKAVVKDGVCYLNYNFVKSFLNGDFYYDRTEKRLLYLYTIPRMLRYTMRTQARRAHSRMTLRST